MLFTAGITTETYLDSWTQPATLCMRPTPVHPPEVEVEVEVVARSSPPRAGGAGAGGGVPRVLRWSGGAPARCAGWS